MRLRVKIPFLYVPADELSSEGLPVLEENSNALPQISFGKGAVFQVVGLGMRGYILEFVAKPTLFVCYDIDSLFEKA